MSQRKHYYVDGGMDLIWVALVLLALKGIALGTEGIRTGTGISQNFDNLL